MDVLAYLSGRMESLVSSRLHEVAFCLLLLRLPETSGRVTQRALVRGTAKALITAGGLLGVISMVRPVL
jgi:hypothetical protein